MSEKLANPAPLGLFGFGMTTVLLNLYNAGLLSPLDSVILSMGIVYGGLAQVIAGVMEYRRGNTFSMVAFSSYGFFWWSLVILLLWPEKLTGIAAFSSGSIAAYFFMWGLFTSAMFFGTLKANRALQFVFISLATLFFLLTIRDAFKIGGSYAQFVGIEGIICGFSAIYLAIAEVLNEAHGKSILPIGQVAK